MTDTDGAVLKLKCAEKHLRSLKRVIRSYVKANPVSVTPKPHRDPLRERLYVHLAQPLPKSLDLLTGDCIHNIRCALDHLVMAMSIANGASANSRGISFPVCADPERFFGKGKPLIRLDRPPPGTGASGIRRLSEEQWAFVEALQPYNRRSNTWLLSEITHLDNRDKHRLLIEHHIETTALFSAPPGVTFDYASRLRLKDGAYFATVTYATGYSGVKVQPNFTASIALERASYPDPPPWAKHVRGIVTLPEFLDDCLAFVREIVNEGGALPGRPRLHRRVL